ncbi:MAG TPA: DmsE family decaheme c-type cytochrome [Steroidobacteraceae bacterium]|nr:DmsE family decaheme c-type cytochrome [Steroidobacteraceae bacterium]
MTRIRAWRTYGAAALLLALMAAGIAPARAQDAAAPAYSRKGADTCLGCHDDPALLGLFRTRHARPNDPKGPFGHGGLQCEACHGPGGAHVQARGKEPAGIVDFGPHALASPARQNAQCLGCHQSNTAHEWAASQHAASNVPCAACHTLHAAHDPVLTTATQVEVCTSCHQAEHTDLYKPSHHPLREGKMACTSCHAPHGSQGPYLLVGNTVTETCTSCHSEYRGPFLWEHQPVAEDCSNCHSAHGSAQPALLKTRPPFLCQQCHEGAGHPSIFNGPQGLPGGAPSAYLLAGGCINCHSQVHGSNHPSGRALMR